MSEIIEKSRQTQNIFNKLYILGNSIDIAIVPLSSKEDTLEKLNTSNLKKLKDLFKKLLSTRTIVSKALNLFLLDYQKDKDNIKTNYDGLRLYKGYFLIIKM